MPRNEKSAMETILREQTVGHLGLCADGEIYVVPLNYTYHDGQILFHCALTGRKLEMIRANPSVCFEVSRQEGVPTEHHGDPCDTPFESVICWGQARIIEDLQERKAILDAFQARYAARDGGPRPPITLERTRTCGAVVITVTRMTGRRFSVGEKLRWEWGGQTQGK